MPNLDLILLQEMNGLFREHRFSPIATSVFGFDSAKRPIPTKISNPLIQDGAVSTSKIADKAVIFNKIQDFNQNQLLGRGNTGTGPGHFITCTPFAQSLLAQTTALAARGTLGIHPLPRSLNEGRITLNPLSPTADATDTVSNLRFVQFVGDLISLWDGNEWVPRAITSGSGLGLYSLAGSPVLPGVATNIDIFLKHDGAAFSSEWINWTNNTTRNTAIAQTDGVWHKTGDQTKRYIGTVRTDGGPNIVDQPQTRHLFNTHNRVPRRLVAEISAASYTYATASWRQANANAAHQVSFVVGLPETVELWNVAAIGSASAGVYGWLGIGEDSTTTLASSCLNSQYITKIANVGYIEEARAHYIKHFTALGYHYLAAIEQIGGGGTATFYGPSAGLRRTGLQGWMMS